MLTEDRMAWLFRQVWRRFTEGGDMDAVDLMQMIERSGLATWIAATAEQATNADCDMDEGDPLLVLTPEARTAISTPAVKELPDV